VRLSELAVVLRTSHSGRGCWFQGYVGGPRAAAAGVMIEGLGGGGSACEPCAPLQRRRALSRMLADEKGPPLDLRDYAILSKRWKSFFLLVLLPLAILAQLKPDPICQVSRC